MTWDPQSEKPTPEGRRAGSGRREGYSAGWREQTQGWAERLLRLAAVVDGREEAEGEPRDQVLGLVLEMLEGARSASMSHRRALDGRISTLASSDPVAAGVDALQYAVGRGPSLQALTEGRVVVVDRLDEDRRWPELAARVAGESAVRSAVCVPLTLGGPVSAALNFYSGRPAVFGGETAPLATLVAAVAAVAWAGVGQRAEAEGLRRALLTSRRIGAAIGILMGRHRWTEQQAFEALVQVSQRSQRKVRDVAEEVLLIGALPGG